MPLSTFLNGRPPTRGVTWLALSDTAIIQTQSIVSDGGGGGTATFAAAGTISCRIDPLSGAHSRVTGGAIDERTTHFVTVPTGSTIDIEQRIAISGRGTYEVTAVRERTAQLTQVFEVIHLQ